MAVDCWSNRSNDFCSLAQNQPKERHHLVLVCWALANMDLPLNPKRDRQPAQQLQSLKLLSCLAPLHGHEAANPACRYSALGRVQGSCSAVWVPIFVAVNFDTLAQASDIRIERRQVVFLCWIQDSNPGSQTPNRQQTECPHTGMIDRFINT